MAYLGYPKRIELKMKAVPSELAELLNRRSFKNYHKPCGSEFDNDVKRFLESTMDEVRTSTSNRIARSILHIIDIRDFGLFRKSVLRRELTGTIAYPRQRDHSSHTLYNYLLGWYFFLNSKLLRKVLDEQFAKRAVGRRGSRWPFPSPDEYFGCIWQYVSLLHDIGYMFEGGLPSLGFRESTKQAAIGVRAARDYFHRQVWIDCNFDVPYLRATLLSLLGEALRPPSFKECDTLGEIASELQFVGSDVSELEEPVRRELDALGISARQPLFDEFSSDAFELWARHYERFDNRRMAQRILSLRNVFNGLIDDGLPGIDLRLLDHGVCSGLLLIMATTYYYRLYVQAKKHEATSALAKRFIGEDPAKPEASPAFWWTGIVWATAATALHNIQQMPDANKLDRDWPGQLSLDDDPLAYLGVLVDVIEEWDRYSVFKVLDGEPIQGTEVELGTVADKIVLRFRGPAAPKRANKLRGNLNDALKDWATLLKVEP
jgi:hypothetical protein